MASGARKRQLTADSRSLSHKYDHKMIDYVFKYSPIKKIYRAGPSVSIQPQMISYPTCIVTNFRKKIVQLCKLIDYKLVGQVIRFKLSIIQNYLNNGDTLNNKQEKQR